MSKFLARTLVVMVLLSACTQGGLSKQGDSNSSKASPGTAEGKKGSTVIPSPIEKSFSAPNVAPPSVNKRDPECTQVFLQAMETPPNNSTSWVYAAIDSDRGMGPECPTMAPGSHCRVPFVGAWNLVETLFGSVVFQVFENDSKVPIKSPELGPIPSGGKFSKSVRLFYDVSPTATKATFRVLIKDSTGEVVARSKPQTVSLPACFVSER